MERNPMSLHFNSSNLAPRQHAHVQRAAVVAQPTAVEERFWQAVALEIAEGLCKAFLLIGSIVTGIVLGIVVAAMSSQLQRRRWNESTGRHWCDCAAAHARARAAIAIAATAQTGQMVA